PLRRHDRPRASRRLRARAARREVLPCDRGPRGPRDARAARAPVRPDAGLDRGGRGRASAAPRRLRDVGDGAHAGTARPALDAARAGLRARRAAQRHGRPRRARRDARPGRCRRRGLHGAVPAGRRTPTSRELTKPTLPTDDRLAGHRPHNRQTFDRTRTTRCGHDRRRAMAELTIRPEEIRAALDSFVKSYEPEGAVSEEVGRVTLAADGIANVEGLPGAMANELLRFEDGTLGLALNLDVREIGVVVLGEFTGIEEGQEVRRTGEVLSVPVGEGYLGRVVDALGNPIDGLGEVETDGRRALELQAPGVMARKSVHEPLQTGLKAIDTMIPIGRGQRQLIIGDRQTGKTAIAIDTIINQKANWETGDPTQQVRCIYVAIGQKGSTIASVRGALEEAGALEYTTIVAAPAS